MSGQHALLSASASSRWINCTRSARTCEDRDEAKSDYADEGSDAHTLGEFKVRQALGMPTVNPVDSLKHYNAEMDEHTTGYAVFILEQLEKAYQECDDPLTMLEQRLDFSAYVPEGFGTGDCVIVTNKSIHIIDMKYGSGILIDAADNSQLMLYGLGALAMFGDLYDIETVSMSIYQPRRENISTHTMPKESLLTWAEEILKPAAALAFAGEGLFQSGEWCRFCKAKAECRERANANMALAVYDFTEPALLLTDEIALILSKVDELTSWASDVKDYALAEAMKGTKFDGWKIVEGRSVRKYTDESAVAKAVQTSGHDPYEHKLLGITGMTSLLGKKRFDEILGGLIAKPAGKPVLVPVTDKRKEMTLNTAAADFAEPLV